MHRHAQTQVELDRTMVHVSSGSEQHVAITISIANLNPPSSKCAAIGMGIMSHSRLCVELSGWGSRALRVHVWSYRDARAASQSGQGGQSCQPDRPDRPARAARSRQGRLARAARAPGAASQSGQGGQSGLRRRIWATMCIFLKFLLGLVDQNVKSGSGRNVGVLRPDGR